MKVSVTGSNGFIGRAVIHELHNRGYDYFPIDKSMGDSFDITNPDVKLYGDAVIHLAGVLGTHELFSNPTNAVAVNVGGTANILAKCYMQDMRYVGIAMPDVWDNIYQATKYGAMRLAAAYNRHRDVPVSHVRAYNVFGPYQKVHGVQKMVPTFAHRAWRGENLPVWGNGSMSVDLIHVDDVARMLVDALYFGNNDVFDGGTGTKNTVNDIGLHIIDYTNSSSVLEYHEMRDGEHYLDEPLCAGGEGWDKLGWTPRLDWDQFNETIDWYKEERR